MAFACGAEFRRERVKVDVQGVELKLSAYLGFVESDPRYPFYTYTVGDTSDIFNEVYARLDCIL